MAALASAVVRRAEIEQRALEELRKLEPPRKVAGAWHEAIASTEQTLLALVKVGERARANDAKGVARQLGSAKAPQSRLLSAGERAGIRQCASVG